MPDPGFTAAAHGSDTLHSGVALCQPAEILVVCVIDMPRRVMDQRHVTDIDVPAVPSGMQAALHAVQMPVITQLFIERILFEMCRVPAEKTFIQRIARPHPGKCLLAGCGKLSFAVLYSG